MKTKMKRCVDCGYSVTRNYGTDENPIHYVCWLTKAGYY